MMQESIINQEMGNLDCTKIAALQQKRTLAFVNHFLITTVQFLNNFMKKCESRLMHFERKLEKVNASLVLLEARLSSIPEANLAPEKATNADVTDSSKVQVDNSKDMVDIAKDNYDMSGKDEDNTKDQSYDPVNETLQIPPEYEKFVKMVHVGVPLQAVKLKLSLEGLDPLILDKLLSK